MRKIPYAHAIKITIAPWYLSVAADVLVAVVAWQSTNRLRKHGRRSTRLSAVTQ